MLAMPARAQEPTVAASGDVQAAQDAQQAEAMTLMDEEARQHFKLGKALYEAGRFPDAAREFDEAYRLSERPQLLYNAYVAHRDASNLPGAIAALGSYLEKVPDAPDRVNLRARLEAMRAAQARQAEQDARAQAAGQPVAPAAVEPRTRVAVERSVVPFVLLGVGGAMIVGGSVTGVLALRKTSDLDDVCNAESECPPNQRDNIDANKTLSLTTDVVLGTGIVTVAVGLTLWLTGALDKEREVPIADLGCTSSGCALKLTQRF
jgi:tetratricopeptide (TPR) repeat protein